MLVLRRPVLRRAIVRGAQSDDDILFSNDRIESNHKPKSNSPFRVALRALYKISLYGASCLFAYTYYVYRNNEKPLEDSLVFQPMLSAVKATDNKIISIYKIFVDPPVDKLLPDMPQPPPGFPSHKTLVLDLKGTILSTEYVFGKGFEIMKRPGLTEFLNKMSQMYEIVIFSDEDTQFTYQLAESIDPKHRFFSGRLGRECLCYRNGELIKDLSYLNRDMRNLIIIEKNPAKVKYQPDNAIILPEYKGDTEDKALQELIPFLEHLVKDRVSDVRKEIDNYGHSETGKNYLKKLELIRSQILARNQRGMSGFFNKMKKQKETEDVGPLEEGTPKPPGYK